MNHDHDASNRPADGDALRDDLPRQGSSVEDADTSNQQHERQHAEGESTSKW
jgi:hypothetical protein